MAQHPSEPALFELEWIIFCKRFIFDQETDLSSAIDILPVLRQDMDLPLNYEEIEARVINMGKLVVAFSFKVKDNIKEFDDFSSLITLIFKPPTGEGLKQDVEVRFHKNVRNSTALINFENLPYLVEPIPKIHRNNFTVDVLYEGNVIKSQSLPIEVQLSVQKDE